MIDEMSTVLGFGVRVHEYAMRPQGGGCSRPLFQCLASCVSGEYGDVRFEVTMLDCKSGKRTTSHVDIPLDEVGNGALVREVLEALHHQMLSFTAGSKARLQVPTPDTALNEGGEGE